MAHYKGSASEGNRAANLIKKREKQREELERMKQKIAEVRFPATQVCPTANPNPMYIHCRSTPSLRQWETSLLAASTLWRKSSDQVPLVRGTPESGVREYVG